MSLVLALQSLFVRIGDRIPIVLRCGMKSASAHFVKNVFVVQDIDYQTCESVMVETWNGNIRAIVYLPVGWQVVGYHRKTCRHGFTYSDAPAFFVAGSEKDFRMIFRSGEKSAAFRTENTDWQVAPFNTQRIDFMSVPILQNAAVAHGRFNSRSGRAHSGDVHLAR